MSPKPSRAVMEGHAPAVVETDDAQTALYRALNYLPTPPWAARAGAEMLLRLDPTAHTIWEPACGEGHIAGPLQDYFAVCATDIHAHGFGLVEDFLLPSPTRRFWKADWVKTNPPFKDLDAFVARGLEASKAGVALLLRTSAVESIKRHDIMQRLAVQVTFSERVPMVLGRWDPEASSATSYGWFYWMHPAAEAASPLALAIQAARAEGMWLHGLFPPGTRDRLWHADDVRKYAKLAPAPLFDGASA